MSKRELFPGGRDALRIREANTDDISALAKLHVETWNATYAPYDMKGPAVATRAVQWREGFARAPRWFCYVVERSDGALVGFAQANPSDNQEFEGELGKIYLLEEYQRQGLGRRLLGYVARRFLELGINSMWLYGDARNPSCHAWLAMGAFKLDENPQVGNYGWKDLRELAAAPE